MSKAKGKPKTPTNQAAANAGAWEASLTSSSVDDEELRVSVYLLSPERVEDKLHLQLLGGAVETNVRHRFVYIERDSLIAQGKDVGKGKDSGTKTAFPEVFGLLKSADDLLPSSTLSKLLKVKVLEHRDAELSKRDELLKGKSGHQSRSPAKSTSPDKGKKDAKKGGKKSPVKKDGGGANIDAEAEITRGKCPLKKRGEEKEEPPKIDDYPPFSPDLFVVCVGFDQSDFLSECHRTGLPITSLMKTSTKEYSPDFAFMEHVSSLNLGTKVVVPDDFSSPEFLERMCAHQQILDAYWREVGEQSTEVPLPAWLVHVGFDRVSLPRVVLDSEIKKDAEKMEELKLSLYENVAKQIYSVQDSISLFRQYNKGMEIVEVVDLTETNEEGELIRPLDKRYYDKLISLLPYESVSHVSVLNCLLEQVCEEQRETKTEIKDTKEDPVKLQLGKLITSLPLSLHQQTEFEGFMALKKEKREEDDQPVVLKEADDLAARSFHLTPNVYPLNDSSLLDVSISNKFLELPAAPAAILNKMHTLAHEKQSFCGDLTPSCINKTLRQFTLEGFDCSRGARGISKLKSPAEYFWDVELLMRPASEIHPESLERLREAAVPKCLHKMDHFNYKTHFDKPAFLQVLSEAYYELPYCERLYHRHDNSMLLLFHSGHSNTLTSRVQWSERIHTEIGFHYFMSRTREEFGGLLGTLPPLTPAPVTSESTAPPTPVTEVEEVEEEPEFQMPVDRLEEFKTRAQLKEDDRERATSAKGKGGKGKPGDKTKSPAGRKGSPSPKRKGSPAKSPSRKSAAASRQSSAQSVAADRSKVEVVPAAAAPEPEMDIVLEEAGRDVFVGFNLPNQILQAAGETSHCHPADGSLVRVEKWGFDGNSPKSRISVMKGGHVLSLNYQLKSDMDIRKERKLAEEAKQKSAEVEAAEVLTTQESKTETEVGAEVETVTSVCPVEVEEDEIPLAKQVSFNAQLKSGMCLTFKKPGMLAPVRSVQIEGEEAPESVEPLPSLLTVSIPTGLVIEYCQQQEGEDYFSVRQTYEKGTELKHKCEQVQAKACTEESSRLCLSTGAVVKHMNNGQTMVLYPDGGYAVKLLTPSPPPVPSQPELTPSETIPPGTPAEDPISPPPPPAHIVWELTKENGSREHVMSDGEMEPCSPLQCYTATDPESKEILFTRMDSIMSVTRPDGSRIVDHTDGTRITTSTQENGDINYKVESVGYATLEFGKDTARTIFGTSTKISRLSDETFVVEEEGGVVMNLAPLLNKVDFSSNQPTAVPMDPADLTTVREHGILSFSNLGQHQFSLDSANCFGLTDPAGNIFNVSYEGQISTEKPDSHVVQHLDHFYRQHEAGAYHEIEEKHRPPIRVFAVQSDGTGTELMSRPKRDAIFASAEANQDVVKVEEDVESDDLAKAYTFLTPYYSSPGSKWVKQFDEGDIVPGGLIYDGAVKPTEQIIGGWEKRAPSPALEEPQLPPAIHYYQVIEDTPIDSYKRECVTNGLKAHTKWLIQRENNSNRANLPDDRPAKEKEVAEKLSTQVGGTIPRSRSPQNDLACEDSLSDEESDVVEIGKMQNMARLEKKRNSSDTLDSVTRKYSNAVSQNPFKMKMKLKKGIIPQAKWDTIMREKMEVNILKSDLRNFRIPSYFDSKFGQAFLHSLNDGPDMKILAEKVPSPVEGTPSATSDKSIETAGGKGESLSTSMILIDGDVGDGYELSSVSLPQLGTPRPGNPTPIVAKGADPTEPKDLKLLAAKSPNRSSEPSPKPNRNMSPHHEEIETPQHDLPSTRQNSKPASGTVASLNVDAAGDPRTTRVRIPRSIVGYKPGAQPNERFLAQEEPVRRGVKTSSVLAAGKRKSITDMRGFQVFPPEVSFGVLCPTGSYATTVTLKNVGIDSCRFQVKCPRNNDGVSVSLHSETNFVAAGMSVKFDVCVTARDVSNIGHVSMMVPIVMETEVFQLPVTATILPIQEYDERSRSGRLARLPQHIKIIDVRSSLNSSSTGYRETSTPFSSEWQSTLTNT